MLLKKNKKNAPVGAPQMQINNTTERAVYQILKNEGQIKRRILVSRVGASDYTVREAIKELQLKGVPDP